MIGFTPGWSYLSGLEDFLHMPRRQNPRLLTPAGTISIGGVQTGVQCLAGPSGWHLLGRTAVRTYQLHRDPIFLLEPGDRVTFSPGRRQNLRGAGPRRGSRRDRRRVDGRHEQTRHFSHWSCEFGAGRRPPRRPALRPDAERRDGSARACRGEYPGRKCTVRRGDRNRSVRRGVHRARRRGTRRAGRSVAQRRHRRARRSRSTHR